MDNEVKAWLYDILNAIMEIDSFFIDIPKEFSSYKNDLRTRRAIERNRIIHGYDSVSDEIIWGIVINHIPILQTEVKNLLEE